MSELDKNAELMRRGQAATAAATLVEDELARRERAIDTAIFKILEDPDKSLDPMRALQACIERHEIHKLRQSLARTERVGKTASKRIATDLKLDSPTKSGQG